MTSEPKMGRKVVIAGGSGFIGSALAERLRSSGREVVVLSRGGKGVQWDGRSIGSWQAELEGAEAVVNLAGRPIACKWTNVSRAEISSSRVGSTLMVGRAIGMCATPPKVWINASAVGIYGDAGDAELDETTDTSRATGFLAEVGRAWEQPVDETDTPQTRKVKLRIGFVLARDGGALPVLAKLTRAFLGGAAGNGRQYMSWIHIADLVGLVLWILDGDAKGIVNATAPKPVTNADFMAELRKVLRRPWSPAAPAPILRLSGKLVGPDAGLLLVGQRVYPRKALDAGFEFQFASLVRAFADLFGAQ